VRVRCFSSGGVRPKARGRGLRRYLPGGWSDEVLPVNSFCIEHPGGLCLFDAGQTARATRFGYHPPWHPFFRLSRFEIAPDDELAVQLPGAGLDPAAVRWVVLSHLHTDHVGGLAPFARAEVLVSRLEWERAQGVRGRVRGYIPHRWPAGLTPRLVDFEHGRAGPFPASHDVAGDRTLLMVPLPGHTPGHSGLLVEGRVLIAADAPDTPPGFTVLRAHDPRAAELAAAMSTAR
jgi:glyoxylase-like metal-dependent hydrolase (beta-lactamase superfamily II)